jgi:hypothetical protein
MGYQNKRNKLFKLYKGINKLESDIDKTISKHNRYKEINSKPYYINKYIRQLNVDESDWENLEISDSESKLYGTKDIQLSQVSGNKLPFLNIYPIIYTPEPLFVSDYYFNYTLDVTSQAGSEGYYYWITIKTGISFILSSLNSEDITPIQWKLLVTFAPFL